MRNFFKNNSIVLLFFTSALAVLAISIYYGSLMITATRMLESSTEQRLLALSRAAALLVTSDELDEFINIEDMDKPSYEDVWERIHGFTVDSNILFTYYMRPTGNDKFQFIIDSDPDPETRVSLSTAPVDYEPAPAEALNGTATASQLGDYSDNWNGILSAYAPIYDENGNVTAIVGVDMSDEQLVSTKTNMEILIMLLILCLIIVILTGYYGFNLYKTKAEQSDIANNAKSQFLSRMSHEIRTPMNAIIGLCRMAKDSDDIDIVKGHLNNISASSTHLLGLINDVLDLSKIESGKMEMIEIPITLKDEIDEICKIVIPQINLKNQHFNVILDENLPDYIYADNTHLRQIIINLLSNAIKFTNDDGNITLEAKLLESKNNMYNIIWNIIDDGIGIDREYISKLFDPFEQGDGGTTRKYGGTGLGLSISKQLIEMMNGEISIESELGKGSKFIFNIWVKAARKEEVSTQEIQRIVERTNYNFNDKYFLVVEDSEINQMIAEDMLINLGAEVDIVNNGLEAVKKFTENPEKYDLIFMDIQMPVMDGYEATRQIRSSDVSTASKIPIVAMTANVFNEDIEKSLESGMNAHIGKPFQIEQIEQVIVTVMEEIK